MSKAAFILYQVLAAALWSTAVAAAELNYPPKPPNVSYAEVLELPYKQADSLYRYSTDANQVARLWLPAQASAVSKLVVFIHGGCWLNEFDMSHTFGLASALSQAGYAVWSLEYRRTGDQGGGWPGSFDDIKAGINYLSSVEDYGLNSAQFAIVGHSAGGHLALLAGLEFPQARAVIGLAAISDIQQYSEGDNDCETATEGFMGGSYAQLPARYDAANPARLPIHPRTTLLHGTADTIVSIKQAGINGANSKIELAAGHFDWVHPGTPAFQLLLNTLGESF